MRIASTGAFLLIACSVVRSGDIPLLGPEPARLLSPPSGYTFNAIDGWGVVWEEADRALGYRIEFDDDPDFTSLVRVFEVSDTEFVYIPGTTFLTSVSAAYWYRVITWNNNGESCSIPAQKLVFVEAPGMPGPFLLNDPEDNSTLDPREDIVFDWGQSRDATGYEFLVDDDPDFSSPVVAHSTGSTTSTVVPGLAFSFDSRYYWTVVAKTSSDETRSSPAIFEFVTEAMPPFPGAFSLLAPEYNTSGVNTFDTLFDWEDSAGATSYLLVVSPDRGLDTPVIEVVLNDSVYSTSGNILQAGARYFWSVLAIDERRATPSTPSPGAFITAGPQPTAAVLALPVDGAVSVTDEVRFMWAGGQYVHKQYFEIDDDPGFGSPLMSVNVGAPAGGLEQYTTPAGVLTDGVYEWRVRSVNLVGDTESTPGSHSLEITGFPAGCEGDTNGDNTVDVNDISYVLFRLGSPPPDGDANGDGTVDVNDISYVLFRLGDPCS